MKIFGQALMVIMMFSIGGAAAFAGNDTPQNWKYEWPNTDFRKTTIVYKDIMEGGPPKDGIPAIDNPIFKAVWEIKGMGKKEPVISLNIKGDVRAYPVRILMFHEIVNDTVGGVPVTITYCPLCNAALVFERTLDGRVLDFGTTGKLRLSDMVMYDRQSESWWQQFTGEAIVGKYTGKTLTAIPSRVESFTLFKERHPRGRVLVPNNKSMRRYGKNPYVKYDSERWPFLFKGDYKGPVRPLSRVVAVGADAWPLSLLKKKKTITHEGLQLTWQRGQNSALDTRYIKKGKDIGNVVVTRDGEDVVYHIPFAFAFMAFNPAGTIYTD
ncbi:MAG: hypothetical protein COB49_09585 [Alphaproteobacteria bacterium]|nr:MAG: hypothetical protein COB49_09585 [Alphaproteobacteria bacterium]